MRGFTFRGTRSLSDRGHVPLPRLCCQKAVTPLWLDSGSSGAGLSNPREIDRCAREELERIWRSHYISNLPIYPSSTAERVAAEQYSTTRVVFVLTIYPSKNYSILGRLRIDKNLLVVCFKLIRRTTQQNEQAQRVQNSATKCINEGTRPKYKSATDQRKRLGVNVALRAFSAHIMRHATGVGGRNLEVLGLARGAFGTGCHWLGRGPVAACTALEGGTVNAVPDALRATRAGLSADGARARVGTGAARTKGGRRRFGSRRGRRIRGRRRPARGRNDRAAT